MNNATVREQITALNTDELNMFLKFYIDYNKPLTKELKKKLTDMGAIKKVNNVLKVDRIALTAYDAADLFETLTSRQESATRARIKNTK